MLSDIDVQVTMKAKLGIDMRPHRILGARPCNATVRQEDDASLTVGFMDPGAVMQMTSHPQVAEVARAVRQKMERARDSISGRGASWQAGRLSVWI